jgi:aspartyl-tRNA(Asn)/glutamyl-tRNA(Gln) amidotransferase subunit B
VSAADLASLVGLVKDGTVSNQAAKRVYAELSGITGSGSVSVSVGLSGTGSVAPRDVAERLGLIQVGDAEQLGPWVDEVLAANPREIERYRAGETKLLGFFTGQVMKRSSGKADPKKIAPLLLEKLK